MVRVPGKGYKVLSVKEEVVTKIQDRAKEEEVSISKLLDKLLEKGSIDTVNTGSNDTVIETIRATIREELKSSKNTVSKSSKDTATDKELSDKDIKRIATEMLLEIGMHIETGIAKGIKDLR